MYIGRAFDVETTLRGELCDMTLALVELKGSRRGWSLRSGRRSASSGGDCYGVTVREIFCDLTLVLPAILMLSAAGIFLVFRRYRSQPSRT